MPDHLHLLLDLGRSGWDLPTAIGAFKSFTTRESWKLRYSGQLWQDRYYDHVLRKIEDATQIGEYMRQNPVRRGLVKDPEDYPWSGMPDPM
jgi:putative transposase